MSDGTAGDDWKDGEYELNMLATRDTTFVAILGSRSEGSIQYVFEDDKGTQINDSGLISKNARGYMALSGVDSNTIESYRDGYDKWVQEVGNQAAPFENITAPTGLVPYKLGAKTKNENSKTNEETIGKVNTWTDYMTMFVILGAGVITAFASLAVYIAMRRRVQPINRSMFKEERVHKKSRIVK